VPHFRIDDALHSHPKAQRAGDEALGMWTRAGSFCMAYLTDGFVPEWWVKQQPKGLAKARKLVTAGLWIDGIERDGETGFQFHEFTGPERQDSRTQIEAEREKWRKKKARQREVSPGDTPGDTHQMSPGDTLTCPPGTPSRDARAVSNPTQPIKNSGYLPESAADPNARDAAAATSGAELVRRTIPSEHPPAVHTTLRLRASELVNTGTPAPIVEAALRLWLTKPNLGPNTLPALVSEVLKTQQPRAAPNGVGKSTQKALEYRQLGRELIQEIHGEQP
jgi:hypothetical protein